MAKLIYATPTSLDGYIANDGDYSWSAPDKEVFAFISEDIRPIGTYLYGRRTYETMRVWQTPELAGINPEFAGIWQQANKIVYSASLEAVSIPRTRLERQFDLEAIREMKAKSPHDISISGPTLAAHAIRAALVDEYHFYLVPAIRGRGLRVLPPEASVKLTLQDERRFTTGWVALRYTA